jgi:hypothetical protein
MTGERHPRFGALLIAAGVIGVVTGGVPIVFSAWWMLAGRHPSAGMDLATHGVEAMGLSLEWALLSSVMGAYLGAVLLWAGTGWRRGRPSARLATWVYASCGVSVCLTDVLIFVFRATPGVMRTRMLVLDGAALAFAVLVAIWLLWRRSPQPSRTG